MATPINARLFKKYDIRGQALGNNAPLTPDVAQAVGQAYGTHLQRHENINQVVVGRDNRATSIALQTALMNGLSKARISVVDLGLVATPVVYWHAVTNGDIAGVMITGSHLAADQNGFKLCIGNRPFYDQRIQDLRQMIDSGDLIHGDGDITIDPDAQGKYIRDLSQRIPASHSLRVVLDAGNGVGGIFAPDLVKAWGHEVLECMYCEPDSNFPNHHPNPQELKNMIDLGNRVRELNADVGIAFDGDSDRMGAVDENGEMIAADRLLALMAQDMLKRRPGASVVADVLCSQVLFDAIESAGGHGYMAASGHSMVKDAMREKNALLGGEMSGHIFLGED
jgi:phosphomannomutase/phosphoglucomutase